MAKWKDNSYKLILIKDIQKITTDYFNLVEKLGNIFLSINEKKELEAEIRLIEQLLKSKLTVSSSMRGF